MSSDLLRADRANQITLRRRASSPRRYLFARFLLVVPRQGQLTPDALQDIVKHCGGQFAGVCVVWTWVIGEMQTRIPLPKRVDSPMPKLQPGSFQTKLIRQKSSICVEGKLPKHKNHAKRRLELELLSQIPRTILPLLHGWLIFWRHTLYHRGDVSILQL